MQFPYSSSTKKKAAAVACQGAATQAHWKREQGGRRTLDEHSPKRPTQGDFWHTLCRCSTKVECDL